jgi:hypothetical protein
MKGSPADGTVLVLAVLGVIGGAGLVAQGLRGSRTIEEELGIKLVDRYGLYTSEEGEDELVNEGPSYGAYVVTPKGGLEDAGEVNGVWTRGNRFLGYEARNAKNEKSPVPFPTLGRAAQWLRDEADAAATFESYGYATESKKAWGFGPHDLEGFHVVRFDPETRRYSVFRLVHSKKKGCTLWVRAKKDVAKRAIRAVRRGMRKSFRF